MSHFDMRTKTTYTVHSGCNYNDDNCIYSNFLPEKPSNVGNDFIDQLIAVYDCHSKIESQRSSNLSQYSKTRVKRPASWNLHSRAKNDLDSIVTIGGQRSRRSEWFTRGLRLTWCHCDRWAGTERVYYGWDHYIADASTYHRFFSCMEATLMP